MTVDRLKQRIQRALGWRRPEDWPQELDPVDIANEAGHWLYDFNWNALARPLASLSIVSGQEWIDLPADFGATASATVSTQTGYGHTLRLVTMEQVRQARSVSPTGNALAYVGCITHTGPGLAGLRSSARLDIGPVPTADATDVFLLAYRAGWVEVTDASDHILCPSWMQSVYIEAATAFVAGREQEEKGTLLERLDRLVNSSLWIGLRNRDLEFQSSYGTIEGGVGSMFGDSCEAIVTHTDVPIVGSNA